MNLRAEIKLKPTRNSASKHSSYNCFDANKKLVLIREIAEPPTGILKHGHTDSLTAFTSFFTVIRMTWSMFALSSSVC